MKTDQFKINQLSPQAYNWYLSYLKTIDAKNIEVYGNFLEDDYVTQFNKGVESSIPIRSSKSPDFHKEKIS